MSDQSTLPEWVFNLNDESQGLFRNLSEVREATYWWLIEYNEERPHDSLEVLTPAEFMLKNGQNSTLQLST